VLNEEHDRPHEDVDAVGICNNFHTSSNTGTEQCCKRSSGKHLHLLSLKYAKAIAIKGKVEGA
jgi:hypothetical protein